MEFEALADLLRARTGLVFPAARRRSLEDGASKIIAKNRLRDVEALVESLRADAALLDELIAEVTIGETYFFRDAGHFDFIRDEIVPEIRRLRGADHIFRIWSAGCATGEEPYSLAILFEELGLASRSRIVGSDISRAALAKAREGEYGSWSLRGDGANLVRPYLDRSGPRLRLSAHIRDRVSLTCLNLAQDHYPSPATDTWGTDLLMCRNVLIYFDQETCGAVARRFFEALAPGGYLITGPSDPLLADHAPFETLATVGGIVYRKPPPGRHASWPWFKHVPETPVPPTPPLAACATPNRSGGAPSREREENSPPAAATSDDPLVMEKRIRALADLGDTRVALALAQKAMLDRPDSMELHFLQAILLMTEARYDDAVTALRRVLYLDRSSAVAQFALGTALHRLGRLEDAARAYGHARASAAQRPADEILTLSDGEQAGRLADAALAQLAIIESQFETLR